jgi:hypothetical protein
MGDPLRYNILTCSPYKGDEIMTKEIELTQGYKAIVDDDMFDELNKHKWCVHKMRKNNTMYATRLVRIHHIVMGFPEKGYVIDHINGNGLDNRRENLRVITTGQNTTWRTIQKNNTSGYRGVSWHKAKQRWDAKIKVNGHAIHLGRFINKEDAAHAYDEAAKIYFKEFAKLNFPE